MFVGMTLYLAYQAGLVALVVGMLAYGLLRSKA